MLLQFALMIDTVLVQLQRLDGDFFWLHILLISFVVYTSLACALRTESAHIWALLEQGRLLWVILHLSFCYLALEAMLMDRNRIFYYLMASVEIREMVFWGTKSHSSVMRTSICLLSCFIQANLLHLFGVVFYVSFELAVLLFDSETDKKQILSSQLARVFVFGLL